VESEKNDYFGTYQTRKKEKIMYYVKNESILDKVQNSKPLQKIIVGYGIVAYNNLIKTEKSLLFKEKNNILVGNPSIEWANRSISDLISLEEKLTEDLTEDLYTFKGIKNIIKTSKEIKERLSNNLESYIGFIENGDWSILNKIDTNYSNWVKLMIPFIDDGKLGSGTIEEKIKSFFEQSPTITVISEKDFEEFKNIKSISYAEYALYNDYLNNFTVSKNTIGRTTYIGDLEENRFKEHIEKLEMVDFSSPGNQVDQIFGIDLLVKLHINSRDKRWIPIQVKARKKQSNYSLIFKLNIGGIVLFPAENFEIKRKGKYGFIDMNGGEERSFDEIFLKY